jgi:undecaprenyl-diphosphatase
MSTHLTYLEASVVGMIQGVTELFPVSSLGHNVLIPAIIGGSWAEDLNVASPESPYLAFIVGLHVATAIAQLIYFWRDWIRIVKGFFTSIRHRRAETPDEKMAWMVILATIPVGLVGLVFEHQFRILFAKPIRAAIFLLVNGLILYAGERFRTRASLQADADLAEQREHESGDPGHGTASHASGQRAVRQLEVSRGVEADRRLAASGYLQALVTGMFRGLSREDSARFAFLLATPVILAAGVLKVPDLTGPLAKGIQGPILVGSILSGVGAYVSVRYLVKYFQTRTLTPFAIYCILFGGASIIYLSVK